MRICFLLVMMLVIAPTAWPKGKGRAAAILVAGAAVAAGASAGHGGALRTMQDPRIAPPLDPERRISEQDCSKPVDWSAGNLRCR